MRWLSLTFLLIWTCTLARAEDFTGIWKGKCSDYYGLQIQRVSSGEYSVTFCGGGGCFEPGSWTPNSRLEEDSKYKIFSMRKIAVRANNDKDHYFTYFKCSDDPTWHSSSASARP
jgi:hypothetical protein